MKSFFFSLLFIGTCQFLYAQEICDNGIDDDGDGFIDLLDDECDCGSSLIPNPSFEEMDCCPDFHSQLDCATTWTQASGATSDYYNTCDYTAIAGEGVTSADVTDIPDGEGWVGYWSNPGYVEYIGACLDGPLLAGEEYTLNFHTAWGFGPANHTFSIFATPDCGDLPWAGTACPTGSGSWELLTSTVLTYTLDGTWQEVTITFTPAVDYNAIAFGGPCGGEPEWRYTYVDNLRLIDSDIFIEITETGTWCDENLELEATVTGGAGTWQWYKDGIALDGETGSTLDVMPYGLGEYTVTYTDGDDCGAANYFTEEEGAISADFTTENVCLGEETTFTNTSVVGDGITPEWEWDFGDGSSSTDESPTHTYTGPGTYTVRLIGINDIGCNDTTEIEVTVDPTPVAHFEFIAAGVSSEDGSTGDCVVNALQFNDLSSIAAPGTITSWN